MDTETITRAIEDSLFEIYTSVDGFMDVNNNSEYSHFLCQSVDYWEFNRNRVKSAAEGKEAEVIDRILTSYKTINSQSIVIITGPNSITPQLEQVMKEKNFEFEEKIIGMSRPTNIPVPGQPAEFEIREVPLKGWEDEVLQKTYETSYGMPEGSGAIFVPFMQSLGGDESITTFVAYDGKKPISVGVLVNMPGPTALFGGAATLPEYRGKGLYTSMLRVRIDKAKEMGNSHVVIQAKEGTSAPIAAKNGFEKICELDCWLYKPE